MKRLVLVLIAPLVACLGASAIAQDNPASKLPWQRELAILNLSMFVLPVTCALSALVVLYLYWRGGSAASYWWYGFPLAATALYLAYAIWLSKRV